MPSPDQVLADDRGDILRFVLLAYGATWLALIPLIATDATVRPGLGWPTHLPALLCPALAAVIAAAVSRQPRAQRADLVRRLTTLPRDPTAVLLALSPLPIGAVALLGLAIAGGFPALDGLSRYSGVPEMSVVLVFSVVLVVNGLGEEVGWRGYLLPRLQRRFGPVRGTAVSGLIWAGWHAPMVLVLANYRAMETPTLVFGLGLGLMCGAFVLAHVTARAGGSIGAAALWHTLFNMFAATALGGVVPAVVTILVMLWAVVLILAIRFGALPGETIALPPVSRLRP